MTNRVTTCLPKFCWRGTATISQRSGGIVREMRQADWGMSTRYDRARPLVLAAGFALAMLLPAHAQTVPANDKSEAAAADPDATADPATTADADDADIKGLELDWSQLNVDASTLSTAPASKARNAAQANAGDMSWSSANKANGAAVSVKQPLSPFWDTRIGADMTVTREPTTMSELLAEKATNGGNTPQSSGTAWAAASAPGVGAIWDKTAIEARVDPSQDQSKLGTSLSKSLPLNEQYSVTLQNGYNVIQQGIVPTPGIAARPLRTYGTEQSAKLSIADTGTSLSAGQTLSSTDDKWLRKIGAEQKLFDGVSISGSIGETPTGTTSKSVTAGFKRSW
jgi:hypothetical protein